MKNLRKILLAVLAAGMGLAQSPGFAEDIDIYASDDDNTGKNPNILVIIDNSANWSSAAQHWPGGIKQGESELNALRTVTSELGADVNLGMMLFTEGSGTNIDGSYMRFHVRPMNATNKSAFSELIGNPAGCTDGANSLNDTPNCIYKNFNDPAEKTGTAKTNYSAAMFEAFKYFGGYTSPANATSDTAGSPVDASHFGALRYAGDPDAKSDPAAYSTDAGKLQYNTPINSTNACAKNYVIFIGNGFPAQDSPSSLLSGVGGNTTQIALPNFTTGSTTQTSLLSTTACGTYASTSACETAAASPSLYDDAYSSYSCTVASTCPASTPTTTTTDLGAPSACGQYADATACVAAVSTSNPGYDSYSCVELSSGCTYTQLNTSNPVVADTGCISPNLTVAATCTSYGNTNYPTYSGFTCTSLGNSGCTGGNKRWKIEATNRVFADGKTFQARGTITTTSGSSASDSHNIFGTRSVLAVTPTGTTSMPTSSNTRYTDEWARFLYQTDVSSALGQQNVITYTIDVFKDQQDNNETALLMSMARAGGGKYFSASNEDAIKNALRQIFSEIQAVNSVFASSSLPVSVQTQGTYLNQIFIGMFRPDGQANPRWAGNLKQYKFKFFADALRMADKNEEQAISSTTGFITPCADSYWSTDSGTYWDFSGSNAKGSCTAQTSQFPSVGSTSIYSDAPDGDVVEKGGAAQRLRGVGSSGSTLTSSSTNYSTRNLKTCDPAATLSCGTLIDFNTTNVSAASLGLSTTTERDNLVAWVRGQDVDDENGNGLSTEVRPSVHGDVLHSQPAVVDYGSSTGVVAYYGANSGAFHAVAAGTTDADGTELWGFVAPETFNRLNRLKINSPLINLPGVSTSISPTPSAKNYFFDGSIGVFQRSGTVWIFPSMRRGGRAIYAFDVSTPATPTLKWRKGCFTQNTADDSDCSLGWTSIGQTWSKPQVGFLSGYTDGGSPAQPKPVLVFGGGYDTCEDTDSQTRCAGARKGAGIWFVDADTGDVIRTYLTNYSVAGDVSLVKDSNGYVKYAYASDTGGYLYRVNVGSYDGTTFGTSGGIAWSNTTGAGDIDIANLSETDHARKFLFGPDVVEYVGYNAVLVGSGDREHPLKTSYACGSFSTTTGSYVKNRFHMIKDTPSGYPSTLPTPSSLTDVTTNLTALETDISAYGWYFDLNSCEQTVNKALTIGGTTFFGTNQPASTVSSSCAANLGVARGYAIDFLTGNPYSVNTRSVVYAGGGLPPSPVGGVVDVDGNKVPFCIGCSTPDDPSPSPLEGGEITINPSSERYRTYWYMQTD